MTTFTKYALVTGGSRGIGRAVSINLSVMGYYVLINYNKNIDEANKTLELIRSKNGDGDILKFDVSKQSEVEKSLNYWSNNNADAYIEVLINNAGISKDVLLMWMSNEDWSNVLDVSLNGFFFVTRYLLKNMLIKKYGRIINVVSLSGLKGLPGQANYSAAKAGVIGATKALAQEVAKKNVTVNAVAPGLIKTGMTKGLNENDLKTLIPMRRFGEAEEVANVVSFLASKQASYITGEVISVNGGLHM